MTHSLLVGGLAELATAMIKKQTFKAVEHNKISRLMTCWFGFGTH